MEKFKDRPHNSKDEFINSVSLSGTGEGGGDNKMLKCSMSVIISFQIADRQAH